MHCLVGGKSSINSSDTVNYKNYVGTGDARPSTPPCKDIQSSRLYQDIDSSLYIYSLHQFLSCSAKNK